MAFDASDFEAETKPFVSNKPINNPGGLRPVGKSTGFMGFPTTEAGRAALEADLAAKGKKGFKSVSDLIKVWAPKEDKNDTDAYIAAVTKHVGSDKIDLTDPATIKKVADAIQKQEGVVPLQEQKTVTGVGVPSVGGGRGGQGGPTAAQAAQRPDVPMTPEQQHIAESTQRVKDFAGATGAFLENIGRKASFGATDYANAAINAYTQDIPFDQARRDVAARNEALEKQYPVASTIGGITGDVTGGVLTGTGLTRLATLANRIANLGKVGAAAVDIGTQALGAGATSAAQEALTNPDATLESVGKAGAVGSIVAGAAGTGAKAFETGVDKFVTSRVAAKNKALKERIEKYNEWVPGENVRRAKIAKEAADEAMAVNKAKYTSWLKEMPESGPVSPPPQFVSARPTLTQAEPKNMAEVAWTTPKEYRETFNLFKQEPGIRLANEIPSTGQALWQGAKQDVVGTVKQALPWALGAGGAFGGYYLGGGEEGLGTIPTLGLAALGGVGALKAKVAANTAARFALMHPEVIDSTIKAGGQIAGSVLGREANPPELVTPDYSLTAQPFDTSDFEPE